MPPEAIDVPASVSSILSSDGLPVPRRYWALGAIWMVSTMAVLDGAIANVALPEIGRDLMASPAESIWVVNAYQLTTVVSLLPLAALGEVLSFRRVYLAGVIAFTVASLGCALMHTLLTLALMRALQGFGAAAIMSVEGALLRHTFPSRSLGRGMGWNALVVSTAAAIGPTVASAILALGPWPWLFAINVPFGIAAVFIARTVLPKTPAAGRFDWTSALLNLVSFSLLFTGAEVVSRGGIAWVGVAEIAASVVVGAALVRRSRRQPYPMIPIDLLKNRIFTLSVVTSIASFTAQMLAFVSIPFFLQTVLLRDQIDTGLLMTPWPFAVGISATLAGRLSDRYSAAVLGSAGLSLLCIGLASLAWLTVDSDAFAVIWRMALCGFGFGFFQAPNNRTLLSAAPITRSGAAGGMLASARLTGQTIGATLAAICFQVADNAEGTALIMAAACAGLAGIASISRLSR